MIIKVKANGNTGRIEDCGLGHDWWAKGDNFSSCGYYNPLNAIARVLTEFGEEDIAKYLRDQAETTRTKFFNSTAWNLKEDSWTIGIAEEEFDKWCANHQTITLREFNTYENYEEYYDDEDYISDCVYSEIDKLIGWRSDWNGGRHCRDRQHMRVGLKCRWGQIEPNWVMVFKNPTFIGYEFDLDKIRDKVRTNILKRDEYYEKLKELQDEYGIYE